MFEHKDLLDTLNENLPLGTKLRRVHDIIKNRFGFIDRIAIAVHEPETGELKTFVSSSDAKASLAHYSALLDEAASLKEIIASGRPRIVNDLSIFTEGTHAHTRKIADDGYSSSYTVPMYNNGTFYGFIFFNSYLADRFKGSILSDLDIFAHLISLLMVNELAVMRTLVSGINMARMMTQYRNPETGAHLERIAQYTKIIATELTDKFNLDDEYIEIVFLSAPLHDVGKISTPDEILLKPGTLSEEETRIMRDHVVRGREIVDVIIETFSLNVFKYASILRNIAEYHHEAVNGSGYARGLKGEEIPLEARIVTVADVFDALTSRRPYKKAWTNTDAFDLLQQQAGETLDKACVEALIKNENKVLEVQRRFKEDPFG